MKKLLVLALSVVMVLAFAAVSMAAVTVSGEVNFGFNLTGNDTAADPAVTPPVEAAKFATSDFGDAKIAATAVLNDEVTAFAALKAGTSSSIKAGLDADSNPVATASGYVVVDEAWVNFTEGFGSVKVGYFGFNVKDNMDILSYMGDLKSNAGINANFAVADGVTFKVYFNRAVEDTDYAAGVDYTTDAFGGSVYMVGSTEKDNKSLTALNAFYVLAPVKLYLNYETQDSVNYGFVGASYDSDSIYARAEFQVAKPDDQKDANLGFRLGYKLGNGAKLEYNSATDYATNGADAKAVSSLKVNVAF